MWRVMGQRSLTWEPTPEMPDYPSSTVRRWGRKLPVGADLGTQLRNQCSNFGSQQGKQGNWRRQVCAVNRIMAKSGMHNNSNVLAFGRQGEGKLSLPLFMITWCMAGRLVLEGGRHERRV